MTRGSIKNIRDGWRGIGTNGKGKERIDEEEEEEEIEGGRIEEYDEEDEMEKKGDPYNEL